MAAREGDPFQDNGRADWLRLRTLIALRWFAIAGQAAAIMVSTLMFGLDIALGPALATVGASIAANLAVTFAYAGQRRLSETEATLMLSFDVVQLGTLLAVTGGLNNPFALLILAPATIAATVLRLGSTVILAGLTVAAICLAGVWHLPIADAAGQELLLPDLFRFGFWIALVVGTVFLALYARQVSTETQAMAQALAATQLALAREQKLTDLGGVVAAAAHELGTPLATIKLVAGELHGELADRPDLAEDAALIGAQADRCRDILRGMGRTGKSDLQMQRAPLETVVREAAEPHMGRGKAILFAVAPEEGWPDSRQPVILRRPEVIHGLRNLIQNAADFARNTVEIESTWTDRAVIVRIEDDGPGFPQSVMPRIGDPFVRRRRQAIDGAVRPGYEGMGLGLFIAKTLLERSGAELSFANRADDGGGAIVIVEWPRGKIAPPFDPVAGGLGENRPIAP